MQIGVSTDTVTNWEKNRTNPDLRAVPGVLKFLGYDPRETPDSIATELSNFRHARGLTQKELANILNVDPSTLSSWEQSKRNPKGVLLERVWRFVQE
jgi:transcriptional regulator with XRE-family HTH domain